MTHDASDPTRSSSTGRSNLALIVAAAVAVLGLLVAGAAVIWSSSDDDADELDGTSWRLESLIVDGRDVAVVDGTSPTLGFADGTVQGDGGCNTFSGSYEAGDGMVSIGPLAVTEIFCEEPAGTADQETAYLARLTQASSFRIIGDRLVLADDLGDSLNFLRS